MTAHEDDVDALVDTRAAEELLGIPFRVPLYPSDNIVNPAMEPGWRSVAAFNTPDNVSGRPFGIDLDLDLVLAAGFDPDETLLHELVHVWQWLCDPQNFRARIEQELAGYGYVDAPHEVEARELARMMLEADVRVYFPTA